MEEFVSCFALTACSASSLTNPLCLIVVGNRTVAGVKHAKVLPALLAGYHDRRGKIDIVLDRYHRIFPIVERACLGCFYAVVLTHTTDIRNTLADRPGTTGGFVMVVREAPGAGMENALRDRYRLG